MADTFHHAQNQLQFAIDMVSGPGDLREKLCEAFKRHLLMLRPDDFPHEMRQDFAALINEFCRSGIHKYGINCERSQYIMTDNQSVEMISKVIALYMQLIAHAESSDSRGGIRR